METKIHTHGHRETLRDTHTKGKRDTHSWTKRDTDMDTERHGMSTESHTQIQRDTARHR